MTAGDQHSQLGTIKKKQALIIHLVFPNTALWQGKIRNRGEGGGWPRYVLCDSHDPKNPNKKHGHGTCLEAQMKRINNE